MVRFKVSTNESEVIPSSKDCPSTQNRWLLIELIPFNNDGRVIYAPSSLNSKQIYAALRNSVQLNFGDVGWGAVSTSLTSAFVSFPSSTDV